MNRKLGRQTVSLEYPPYIISHSAVVGQKEGEGPLRESFDMIVSDEKMGMKSWDLAEGMLQRTAAELALKKCSMKNEDIDYKFIEEYMMNLEAGMIKKYLKYLKYKS